MGRPSKLTEAQWQEITARLSKGEKASDLAREFKVSKASVSVRVSKLAKNRKEIVESVANQLVSSAKAYGALSVSEQQDALSLGVRLTNTSYHMGGASETGAAIAHRLTRIASTEMDKVDDANPLETLHHLKAVSTLLQVAKDAAHIPLNLLAANKDQIKALQEQEERQRKSAGGRSSLPALPVDDVEASRVYRDIMSD